jgi:hypothetical protein
MLLAFTCMPAPDLGTCVGSEAPGGTCTVVHQTLSACQLQVVWLQLQGGVYCFYWQHTTAYAVASGVCCSARLPCTQVSNTAMLPVAAAAHGAADLFSCRRVCCFSRAGCLRPLTHCQLLLLAPRQLTLLGAGWRLHVLALWQTRQCGCCRHMQQLQQWQQETSGWHLVANECAGQQ